MSQPVWRQIRDDLTAEISEDRYTAGDRLPSEAALAARFGVNRHTVRRALKDLADQGLVHARRGAGVFVTGAQISYRLGPRTRFRRNLAEGGHSGRRDVLRAETLPANGAEAKALALKKGTPVHVLETVALADNVPIAYAIAAFPAALAPGFLEAHARDGSITLALKSCGISDYKRRSTRLVATRATGTMARHLKLGEGAPALRAVSVNVLPDGTPVEYGQTWFASDRVELVVDDQSLR